MQIYADGMVVVPVASTMMWAMFSTMIPCSFNWNVWFRSNNEWKTDGQSAKRCSIKRITRIVCVMRNFLRTVRFMKWRNHWLELKVRSLWIAYSSQQIEIERKSRVVVNPLNQKRNDAIETGLFNLGSVLLLSVYEMVSGVLVDRPRWCLQNGFLDVTSY